MTCMSSAQIGWVAGLLEGEGWFGTWTTPRHKKSYARIAVQMTDEDVVRRLHTVTGVGVVGGPYPKGVGKKDTWRWYASAQSDVIELLHILHPLMGTRRQQKIESILLEIGEK